LKIWVDKNRRS